MEFLEQKVQDLLRARWNAWPQRMQIGEDFFEPEVQKALRDYFPRGRKCGGDEDLSLPIRIFIACDDFSSCIGRIDPLTFDFKAAYAASPEAAAGVLFAIAQGKGKFTNRRLLSFFEDTRYPDGTLRSNVDLGRLFERASNSALKKGNRYAEQVSSLADAATVANKLQREVKRREGIVREWVREVSALIRFCTTAKHTGITLIADSRQPSP